MTVDLATSSDRLKPEPAGFWLRAVARLIDDWILYFVLRLAIVFVLALAAGAYEGLVGEDPERFTQSLYKSTAISWIGSVFAILCYHTLAEGIGGATIGKRIFGLQVSDESLKPCDFVQGFKRSLAFFYDGLFFGLVAEGYMKDSRMKQRAGDEWARTVVVKRRSVAEHRSVGRLLAGWGAATVGASLVILVARVGEYVRLAAAG